MNPVIQILRPISPIAWIPVAIMLFGIGDTAAVFLIFLAAFFPIVVSAMNGVRNVPAMYRRAGRNFGLSPSQLLSRVVLPAALPQMLVGLRIALGIAWLVVVAAEMIASNSGLGYLVIDARNSGKRYDLVVAAMIMIGVIGLALDLVIRRAERLRSVRWGFRDETLADARYSAHSAGWSRVRLARLSERELVGDSERLRCRRISASSTSRTFR